MEWEYTMGASTPTEIPLISRQLNKYISAQKSPNHQSGTVHVTTHRLFNISTQHVSAYSLPWT